MSIHGVVAVLGIGVELGYVYEGAANLGELTRAANESTHPVIHPSLGTRFSRLRFACHDALDEYLIPLSVMKVVFPYTGPTPLV